MHRVRNSKAASFDGPQFAMSDDRSYVKTKVIDAESSIDISPYLSHILQDSILKGKRVVIFDVEWNVECLDTDGKKCKQHPSSVKLSTINLCLLIKLQNLSQNNLKNLGQFFASKFVTFLGVQIEEDLGLLRDTHGFVIRNAVDPRKFAAKAHHSPLLEYLGLRELADKILFYDMRRLDTIHSYLDKRGSKEHLEAAAIEGWLLFQVWDRLCY